MGIYLECFDITLDLLSYSTIPQFSFCMHNFRVPYGIGDVVKLWWKKVWFQTNISAQCFKGQYFWCTFLFFRLTRMRQKQKYWDGRASDAVCLFENYAVWGAKAWWHQLGQDTNMNCNDKDNKQPINVKDYMPSEVEVTLKLHVPSAPYHMSSHENKCIQIHACVNFSVVDITSRVKLNEEQEIHI